ncbi:hypothetical protein GW17_00003725 [Ensete ventricosum]|nr:hypothetical protein GW17_00003725 [Ensete ventricosum]
MGTLPSSCFFNPSLRPRQLAPGRRCRERYSVMERVSPGELCFLCRKRVQEWRIRRRFDGIMCFSINGNDGGGEEKGSSSKSTEEVEQIAADEDLNSEPTQTSFPSRGGLHTGKPSDRYVPPGTENLVLIAFQTPSISSGEQVYSSFQVDSIKLLELLGPEKVDPSDVKLIKEKLFGYSTFWVTREEPFGDLGEGILFLGNLRGKRENVFAKLQQQLHEVTGDKYNLFMVEEPNSEGLDPRGGPRVSFGLLRKEVSEPGPTTLWQYVIALLLFVLTIGSCVELGIASQINTLPPEVVKYFTDPNATEPPDMQLLYPFVDSALPLAYGVLGVQLFHFKSILPDRRTKVDISMAGPLAGAALSFSMFFVGLLLSSNPATAGDLVQVPSMLFQGSLLLGLISRATLGYT